MRGGFAEGAHGAGGDAAVDEESLAGDVAAGFGSEKDDGAVEVVWFAGTLDGNAFSEIFDPFGVFVHDFILFGAEPAGGQAIDGDAVLAPIVGETHGELANAAATGAVRAESGITGDSGDRADVDDAAVVAVDHAASNGLRDEKTAAQVCIENQIPIFPSDFERGFANVAAGVVDEDVDVAEVFFGGGDHLFDAVVIADVEFEREGFAAEGMDFFLEFGEVGFIAAGEDQVGAGFGERASEVLAEAAAGTGDDGDFVGEVEEIVFG